MSVCRTIFYRDFVRNAREMSRLPFRTEQLRLSHCSQCQVWSGDLSPMAAETTLLEHPRRIGHWVCDYGWTRKPQQSNNCPPLGSTPGPDSGETPNVAESGFDRRSVALTIARWRFTLHVLSVTFDPS